MKNAAGWVVGMLPQLLVLFQHPFHPFAYIGYIYIYVCGYIKKKQSIALGFELFLFCIVSAQKNTLCSL